MQFQAGQDVRLKNDGAQTSFYRRLLSFSGNRQAVRRLKALHLGRLNIQFQQDWPKDKKLQLFLFLA